MAREADETYRGAAVVTGAAQGIGAIAARFAQAGHPVVGLDLDGDRMVDTAAA